LAVAMWAASEIVPESQPADFRNEIISLAGAYIAANTLSENDNRPSLEMTTGPGTPPSIPEEMLHGGPYEGSLPHLLDTQPDFSDTQGDDQPRVDNPMSGSTNARNSRIGDTDWMPMGSAQTASFG